MSPFSWTPVARILGALSLATSSFAATYLADGYSMRIWQTEDGLPQNTVTSAVQTHDGYLWFGTDSGLARFDGERFQVFNTLTTPELEDRRIMRLYEDAKHALWIAQENGAIARYAGGRFENIPLEHAHENARFIGLGSDEQGRLWGMRDNGAIDSVEDGHRIPSLIAPSPPGIMSWSRGADGAIWLSENGQAARLQNGVLNPFSTGEREKGYVLSMAAAAAGGAWVLCDEQIRRWDRGDWVESRGRYPWESGSISCLLELRDGTLAVGTIYAGLFLIFPDGRPTVHFNQASGLPQNWVRFLYEDREGNLWLGAGSAGLVAIHSTAFSVLNSPDSWGGTSVVAVAPGKDGGLWIGTDGGGLYHHLKGEWRHYGPTEELHNPYIRAVTETPQGEVWAGNYWWGGPYRLEKDHFVRPSSVDPASPRPHALLPLPGGGLLVGSRDGLQRLDDERTTWLIKASDHQAADACALALDTQGAIWCGFAHGGLARLADGQLSFLRRSDGLASDAIQCLLSEPDGTLWIGTADNGLARLKHGRFANLGLAQGMADNVICAILDDGLGNFWISTHHGIQRIAREELNRCADGIVPRVRSQVYYRSDGLPTSEFKGGLQAAGCRTSDGRLWFPSSRGLVSVDPTRIQSNAVPPPVAFESVLIDGRERRAGDTAPLRLPPDHQRLEFRFSGLSYVDPGKVLFKYRLDGIDKDWVEAGSKRNAFYSQLPAGAYRFRVIACNNDGVWNTEGAALAFTVAPFFWQTWCFTGSSALALLAAVGSFVRYLTRRRMQRRIAQLERERAIERERARIAQDIHDEIGASLTRISMLSQPARKELAAPDQAAAVLSGIYSTASEVTRSLDEIVWAVDPKHDTLDSLVGYMGKFAQDFLGAAGIRCRLDLPTSPPAWPLTAETRHNLFLAFKETLNNALKHAGATEVRLSLQLRADGFVLTIKDNGRGFDPESAAAPSPGRASAGNGLDNLSRRLAHIGGRCEIAAGLGSGTEVSFILTVPAAAASTSPIDTAP